MKLLHTTNDIGNALSIVADKIIGVEPKVIFDYEYNHVIHGSAIRTLDGLSYNVREDRPSLIEKLEAL